MTKNISPNKHNIAHKNTIIVHQKVIVKKNSLKYVQWLVTHLFNHFISHFKIYMIKYI